MADFTGSFKDWVERTGLYRIHLCNTYIPFYPQQTSELGRNFVNQPSCIIKRSVKVLLS